MLKVIGIGNRLRGDDAIGPVIIEHLERRKEKERLALIDAGGDAFAVLDHLLGDSPVLIIDCARMGLEPGQVRVFDVDEVTLGKLDKMVSLHSYGFAQIYTMARQLGPVAPCKIIGVEPLEAAFDKPLSQKVKNSIPAIIEMIYQEAKNYVQENIDN